MRKLRVIWICIILTIHYTTNIIGQQQEHVFERQLEYAYRLESSSQNQAALKEYLRLFAFDSKKAYPILPDIANLYWKVDDISNAIKYYNLYFYRLPYNSAARNEIQYKKANIYITQCDYQRAKIEILQINRSHEIDLDKYYFYKAMVLYMNDEYSEGLSQLYSLSYIDSTDLQYLKGIEKKLLKNNKPRVKIYRIASGAIPGMGQYLAGDIKGGLNSTLLNGALIYTFFRVGERLTYLDAGATVGPWLARYFLGGVANAGSAYERKQEKKKSKYLTQILTYIEEKKASTPSTGQ